jgi:hypothetical protein
VSAFGKSPADEVLPSFPEQLAQQLGGVRGLIESSIPVIVFVVANLLGPLRVALGAAVLTAVALAVYRLARRESIRHAVNGLFGILVGVAVAWKTGNAKDFYLPGILLGLVYALAMVGSVAVGHPLVGWLWSIVIDGGSTQWRSQRRLVRTFSWLTLLWASVYLIKVGIQTSLFLTDKLTDVEKASALGVVRLALGYPPYLLLLGLTVLAVRRSTRAGVAPLPAAGHRADRA